VRQSIYTTYAEASWTWRGSPRRCFQHEIDHLDGVLTLDRATPEERRRAIAVLLEQAA
jgi:peptide deformylase